MYPKPSIEEIKEKLFQIESNDINCMNLKNHKKRNFPKSKYMTKPDGLFSYCESCSDEIIKNQYELELNNYNLDQLKNLDDYEYKNPFHEHLDTCQQCAEHPFNLCQEGIIIMKYTMHVLELQLNQELKLKK